MLKFLSSSNHESEIRISSDMTQLSNQANSKKSNPKPVEVKEVSFEADDKHSDQNQEPASLEPVLKPSAHNVEVTGVRSRGRINQNQQIRASSEKPEVQFKKPKQ